MNNKTIFGISDILDIIPHRPPFLFIDRIIKFKPDITIVGEYFIKPDSPYFKGHFPGKPIMPGVLVTDALAQISGLLWGFTKKAKGDSDDEKPKLFYLATVKMKFLEPAKPGETLTLHSNAEENFASLFLYKVEAYVNKRTIAKGKLTLAIKE